MKRRRYDPLSCIPSADAIREKLHETLTQAERLRLLLELAERLSLPVGTATAVLVTAADGEGVSRGR